MPSVWGLTKEQANYRDAPSPAVQCKVCKFMFPPLAIGSCRFVRGVIEGSKTCDEFAPRKSGQTQPKVGRVLVPVRPGPYSGTRFRYLEQGGAR
jgi:hypothetical protein